MDDIDYVENSVPYSNERLAVAAANNPVFLAIKNPRAQSVLDAMRRVDRADFLPGYMIQVSFIDTQAFEAMESIEERMRAMSGIRVRYAGFENEMRQLANDFSQATTRLLKGGMTNYVITPATLAYNDCTIPIACDQRCSKPSLVAFMNDLLDLKEGQDVLEIGTGCGYHAAVTLEQIGDGQLTTIERHAELAETGSKNLERYAGRITVVSGDGKAGHEERAPYDRIYITAGVKIDKFDADVFIRQLKKDDGKFLFPEPHGFHLMGYRGGETFETSYPLTLSFMPLV